MRNASIAIFSGQEEQCKGSKRSECWPSHSKQGRRYRFQVQNDGLPEIWCNSACLRLSQEDWRQPAEEARPWWALLLHLSCLVLSCLVLSCLVLSCLVLSCLVLSCLVLPCLVLSCLVLSCLVHNIDCFWICIALRLDLHTSIEDRKSYCCHICACSCSCVIVALGYSR